MYSIIGDSVQHFVDKNIPKRVSSDVSVQDHIVAMLNVTKRQNALCMSMHTKMIDKQSTNAFSNVQQIRN